MADFDIAFRLTITGNEGGYNPGEGEKETYMGIDRGANPNWSGWAVIDAVKRANPGLSIAKMNLLLSQNIALQANIRTFYKTGYWNTLNLNNINDQQLANNLFDCSVNQGEGMARKFIQIACNYVIMANKLPVKPLVIDGQIGSVTIGAFNSLPPAQLNAELNAEREASYRTDADYAQWGKIWERRLIKYT